MRNFLALEASAGSGKTFALSARYIALILSGAKVSETIALTFTKKAASEMKSRIIETFIHLDKDSKKPERDEICRLLEIGEADVFALIDKTKAEFLNSNLKILTFDSFFSSILKSFALNIGLNPNFIMDENISHLKRQKFIQEICKNKKLCARAANFALGSESGLNGFFEAIEELDMNNIKLDGGVKTEPDISKVRAIISAMREFCEKKNATPTAINSFKTGSIKEILSMPFLSRDSMNYKTFSKVYESNLDEMFFELKDELKRYCDALEVYSLSELEEFLHLYKDIQIALNKKLATLSFSDISSQTHRLFYDDKFDANMLYFRLDAKIKHLLVDEFQDTNVVQFEILLPLIDEIVAGYGQSGLGSFFYVGDKKQSIYRFRGGKKELFDKLMDDYSQIKKQNLELNYRSQKGIVSFVNFIFKDKISSYIPQKSPPYSGAVDMRLLLNGVKNGKNLAPFSPSDDDFGYIKVKTAVNSMQSEVANEIKNLLKNGANLQNIAVLCWKNNDARLIQEELFSANIKSSLQSTKLLFDTPYVRAVLEYAKFCLTKESIYAQNVEAILDIKVKFVQLNLDKNALQTIKFITEILAISCDNEDILLLFEVALKYSSIIDLLFSSDATTSFYEQSDGARIMTVHKSKGLQFDHVILCDSFGKSPPNSSKFIYEYDLKNGWEIRQNLPKESVDDDFAKFKEKSNLREYEESINKLYVAFTRAKNSLIIIKQNEPNGNKPSYFTPFNDRLYLDICDFEFGMIIPDEMQEIKADKVSKKKIKLAKISPQDTKTAREDEANLAAIYFGNALHYTLEMCEKFDESSLEIAINLSKNRYLKFIGEEAFVDIKMRVLHLFENREFAQICVGGEIYKEQPFKSNGEIKQLDLMVVKDGEIIIFDYKSSQKFIDTNISQVRLYKEALTQIYKDKVVKASIIFLLKEGCKILEV